MHEPKAIKAGSHKRLWKMVEQGRYLDIGANLETAMPIFMNGKYKFLPVVTLGKEKKYQK